MRKIVHLAEMGDKDYSPQPGRSVLLLGGLVFMASFGVALGVYTTAIGWRSAPVALIAQGLPACRGALPDSADSNCAAWVSAVAAVEGAEIARRSFWSNLAGIVLVGFGTLVSAAAAFAAYRAARATERSNQHAEDTAKRQLRAYLYSESRLEGSLETDEEVTVTLRFTNAGQTPAYDLQYSSRIKVGLPNAAELFFERPSIGNGSRATLGAGQTVKMPRTISLKGTQLDQVRQGNRVVYLWGAAKYRDAFDIEHESQFRVEMTRTYGLDRFIRCPRGNADN